MIITIDGTSGAGKSTAGKELAKALNCPFLSSGEIYRALAKVILANNIDSKNEAEILKLINKTKVEIKNKNNLAVFYINGQLINSSELHNPQISSFSAKISPIKELREYARTLQQEFAKAYKTVVVEGRDVGSVVFPNADVKFFITASLEVRAQRRFDEYIAEGKKITYDEVYNSLKERDYHDENRKFGKLIVPDGAVVIETSNMKINEVLNELLKHTKK